MTQTDSELPRVFDVLAGEAESVKEAAYGRVGVLYGGRQMRAEWICKLREPVDRGWFSQERAIDE